MGCWGRKFGKGCVWVWEFAFRIWRGSLLKRTLSGVKKRWEMCGLCGLDAILGCFGDENLLGYLKTSSEGSRVVF